MVALILEIDNIVSKQLFVENLKMTNYPRGSEWRRWDLHIHTPNTKKNDQFSGATTEEKWNNYYSDIIKYVGDGTNPNKTIAVIGITDYLSLDNYLKVITDKKLPESVKLILPNIEMRIQPIAQDSPINIHFIFNPEIVSDLESRFFSKLQFPYGENLYDATRSGLIRLGKIYNPELEDEQAYKAGINQFVPSFDSVKKVFQQDPDLRNNVIIGVSNSSGDGVSGTTQHCSYLEGKESQLKSFRQSIYHFVDVIFSSFPSDIKYFLGKKDGINSEIVKRQCGSLKACIIGSDAHKNEKIFEPDNKKYCWIKADPTFNGLKQILYEPEERVCISDNKPEIKENYYVIDKAEFNVPDFPTNPIYFNDKLTCIIGGKSTGKSILLQNMAKAIAPTEVQKSLDKSQNKTFEVDELKVYWADGEQKDRKIIYIPQTYLNRLSDKKEEKTEIDQWIQEVLFQYPDIKMGSEKYYADLSELKLSVDKNIIIFINYDKECKNNIKSQKEIGDKAGIIATLDSLYTDKKNLSKDLNVSEEDINSYNNAVRNTQIIEQKIHKLEQDKIVINNTSSLVQKTAIDSRMSESTASFVLKIQNEIIDRSQKEWEQERIKLLTFIEEEITKEKSCKLDNEKIIAIKRPLVESCNAIAEISKRIIEEENKKKQIEDKEKELAELKQKQLEILDNLCQAIEKYKSISIAYKKLIDIEGDDIRFLADVVFRQEAFVKKTYSLFDARNKELKELINDEFSEAKYTKDNIKFMVQKVIDDEWALKSSISKEDVLRELFNNWYNTRYQVEMDGDTLDMMSPGKKALVLLKILVSLAESKCPILIDQPEDDLDNRSIYRELVNFIKQKKKERQIIIVTHNANIVIGADAEEVIIANQQGQDTPNKQFKFEYISGAIENNTPVYKHDGSIEDGILNSQGIQQHICDVLEGGERAFELRKNKYHI